MNPSTKKDWIFPASAEQGNSQNQAAPKLMMLHKSSGRWILYCLSLTHKNASKFPDTDSYGVPALTITIERSNLCWQLFGCYIPPGIFT